MLETQHQTNCNRIVFNAISVRVDYLRNILKIRQIPFDGACQNFELLIAFAYSPFGVFPVPFGQFSVTYPRRTGGEHFRMDHVTRNALAARKNEA